MPSPLPQLTTILLLIHLGFGCCAHHLHACESDCCEAPIASAESCPCGTHQHAQVPANTVSGLGNLAERGHDDEQHRCDGDSCTFVLSNPLPEEIGKVTADNYSLEFMASDSDAGSCRSQPDRNLARCLSIAGSSLRTHLVLRVMLI